MEKVEISLPLNFNVNKPDRNGRIISNEVMEKALKDKLANGGIPVTIGSSYDTQKLTVDQTKKVGMIKRYDLDKLTADVEITTGTSAAEIMKEMIDAGIPLSLGYRAVGNCHNNEITKFNIISFEVRGHYKEGKDE